jgi:hypothetical protein
MKSSPFYVVLSGDFGLVLPSSQLVHYLAKLATFSMLIQIKPVQFILTFYSAFKYCCRARGEKWEKTKITYACLARIVRDGGFKIALIARLSAIPGHCQFVMKMF